MPNTVLKYVLELQIMRRGEVLILTLRYLPVLQEQFRSSLLQLICYVKDMRFLELLLQIVLVIWLF